MTEKDIRAESVPAVLTEQAAQGNDGMMYLLVQKPDVAPSTTLINDETDAQLRQIMAHTKGNEEAYEGAVQAAQRFVDSKTDQL